VDDPDGQEPRQPDADTNGRNLRFVLVADPGLPSEMARDLAPRLPEDLRRRIARGIRWQADTVTAPLVADEQVDVAHVAEIVGTRLDGDWDIGVFLTDLPSRMERNPVSTEFEREHRVALISLPALGSRRLRRRVRQAVVGVVGQQAAQDEEPLVRRRRRAPGEDEVSRGWASWTRSMRRVCDSWIAWVVSLDQVRSLSSSAC
jgi:hypothetical protein